MFQRRLVTLWAWLMRFPACGFLPQISHCCAIGLLPESSDLVGQTLILQDLAPIRQWRVDSERAIQMCFHPYAILMPCSLPFRPLPPRPIPSPLRCISLAGREWTLNGRTGMYPITASYTCGTHVPAPCV